MVRLVCTTWCVRGSPVKGVLLPLYSPAVELKRRIGCLGRDFLRRCVAPQVLKTVEFAHVALEDMYYDVDIVEQYPAQTAIAFAVPDFHPGIPEFVDNVISDRARLHIGIHRANHEIVADRG